MQEGIDKKYLSEILLAAAPSGSTELRAQAAENVVPASVRTRFFGIKLNFVLQCVLTGALGSFLFGFSLSNLNLCLGNINSEFLMCGQPHELSGRFATPALCAADATCAAVCGVYDDPLDPKRLTKVRCPGGYNDISCGQVKWTNAGVVCAVLVGGACGAAVGGGLLGKGRRFVLLVMFLLFQFGAITSIVAHSLAGMIWGRLVVGFGVGLGSLAPPTYMSELTPAAKRGKYGVLHQLSIVVGQFFAMLLGFPLASPGDQDDSWSPPAFQKVWWRFMLGLPALLVLFGIFLLNYVYRFETPIYYVERDEFKAAEALLKLVHDKSDVSDEMTQVVESVQEGQRSAQSGMTLGKAFGKPAYAYVLFVGILLAAFQQLGGINVFMTSSADLFRKAGLSGTLQVVVSVGMVTLLLLSTIPAMLLIDKLGRRTLLLWGSAAQFLFVAPAAVAYLADPNPTNPSPVTQNLAIVGVLGFVSAFAFGFGPVVWVYLFEIFPLEIKNVAAGFAATCNWLSGIAMVFASLVLPNHISFSIFAFMQLLATVFIFVCIRETRGLPLGKSPFLIETSEGTTEEQQPKGTAVINLQETAEAEADTSGFTVS